MFNSGASRWIVNSFRLMSSSRIPGPKKRRAAHTQADSLRSTREAHAREISEDYVEAIADLVETVGEARVTDLARRLGVTHVTVNHAIARLQEMKLVTTQPYRSIFLTKRGQSLAVKSKQRHEIVVRFLRSLGIPKTVSQRDAEGIEHHVSPETLAAMEKHLESGNGVNNIDAPKQTVRQETK